MKFQLRDSRTNWKYIAIIAIVAVLVGGILVWIPNQPQLPVEHPILSSGQAIITGQLITQSDVQTIPNSPVTKGSIVLIPSERFNSFLKEKQISSNFNEEQLWHLQMGISKEITSKYIVGNSPLNSKGKFTMIITQGKYVLCVSSPKEQLRSQFPVSILGCARIEAQEGQKLDLNLASVEGGLRIVAQKTE